MPEMFTAIRGSNETRPPVASCPEHRVNCLPLTPPAAGGGEACRAAFGLIDEQFSEKFPLPLTARHHRKGQSRILGDGGSLAEALLLC